MNRTVGRRHFSIAVVATSLAVASGCASHTGTAGGTATPTVSGASGGQPTAVSIGAAMRAGLTVSNGTADLRVGDTTAHFSSTVTDATWSFDGSRIAYIDGDGNVASARPDGSDVVVLTKTDKSVKRAQPAWAQGGSSIYFSERGKDGVWRLMSADASAGSLVAQPYKAGALDNNDTGHDTGLTSAYVPPSGADEGKSVVAYEHDAAKGAQVWIIDQNQRSPEALFLLNGAQPALSPDGTEIAYVGSNGQLYVTAVAKPNKSAPKQVTFGATGITHPVWTTDGSRITYATPSDIESVAAKLAAGVTTNPAHVESAATGIPAYGATSSDVVSRVTGADPIADSVAVSRSEWNRADGKVNIAAQGSDFPSEITLVSTGDQAALTGIPDLGRANGPFLFTDGKTLDPRTAAEIKRALGKKGPYSSDMEVRLLGTKTDISDGVSQAVAALGYKVVRLSKSASPDSPGGPVVVVSDTDQAAIANVGQLPFWSELLLVHGSTLTTDQRDIINAAKNVKVLAGGADAHTALQAAWPGKPLFQVTDLPPNSVDESIALATPYFGSIALVAAGDWKDMLLANAARDYVIVLGADGSLTPSALTWLNQDGPSIHSVMAFGSGTSVPDATLAAAAAATGGPAG